MPKKIIELLINALKTLFIPSENYFTNKFDNIKSQVASKFGFDTYIELFNALKSHVSGSIDFGGYIDISMWTNYLPTLQNFIRGFYYVMAIIFNIKMVMNLVRHNNIIQGGK